MRIVSFIRQCSRRLEECRWARPGPALQPRPFRRRSWASTSCPSEPCRARAWRCRIFRESTSSRRLRPDLQASCSVSCRPWRTSRAASKGSPLSSSCRGWWSTANWQSEVSEKDLKNCFIYIFHLEKEDCVKNVINSLFAMHSPIK